MGIETLDIVRNHHQCQKTFFVARANTEFALFAHPASLFFQQRLEPYYEDGRRSLLIPAAM